MSIPTLLAGCIIVPLPEHGLLAGRGAISEEQSSFLQVGETTREAVLLTFGEPDLVLQQQRVIVYYWEVSHGYWAVGAYTTGAAGPIGKIYALLLEFDERGYLKHCERVGSFFGATQSKIDALVGSQVDGRLARGRTALLIDPLPDKPALVVVRGSSPAGMLFSISEVIDRRSGPNANFLVGQMTEFGRVIADVVVTRPPVDILRSTLIGALETAGLRFTAQTEDVTVHAELLEFNVSSSIGLITGDAVGTIEIFLEARSKQAALSRRFKIRSTRSRLLGYHTAEDFEEVLRSCLEDMQQQLANDRELMGLFQPSAAK